MMREIIFLFDGQGAFKPGIGKELYAKYPKAKAIIEQSGEVLGYTLTDYLWGDKASETSNRTSVAQPAISIVSLAYAEVLRDLGVEGAVSLGHSLGEATAIVYCGILSVNDGIRMIQRRGEVMEAGGGKGTMMAILNVGLPDLDQMCKEVTKKLSEPVVVANINAPNQVVISGSHEAVKKVAQGVVEKHGRGIPLGIGGAWHSPFLEDASREFSQFLDGLQFNKPERKFYSVVEQKILEDPNDIKDALKRQMLSRVDWVTAIESVQSGGTFFLEIGPSKILRDLVAKIDGKIEVDSTAMHGAMETLVKVFQARGS
jgi:[acyl-carrier-protein] S-malonyltransferase